MNIDLIERLAPLPPPPQWTITGAEQQGALCDWALAYARTIAALVAAAEREKAMAAILEGCPNDGSDIELVLRRAWDRVRGMP